jgi:hypothetical protein
MKHIYKRIALLLLTALPVVAHAHPGHPEDGRHVVGGFVLLAALVYALKQSTLFVARRAERPRKR